MTFCMLATMFCESIKRNYYVTNIAGVGEVPSPALLLTRSLTGQDLRAAAV